MYLFQCPPAPSVAFQIMLSHPSNAESKQFDGIPTPFNKAFDEVGAV